MMTGGFLGFWGRWLERRAARKRARVEDEDGFLMALMKAKDMELVEVPASMTMKRAAELQRVVRDFRERVQEEDEWA